MAIAWTIADVHGFDLDGYARVHRHQNLEQFLGAFPYDQYLRTVAFTDFQTLQQHRTLLWKRYGDGDQFLYHLGDAFNRLYPVGIADLSVKVAIGEAYLAPKQGLNQRQSEIYQIIGFYLLGQVARKLEDAIAKKQLDIQNPEVSAFVNRLKQNRVHIQISESTWDKVRRRIRQGDWKYIFGRIWDKTRERFRWGKKNKPQASLSLNSYHQLGCGQVFQVDRKAKQAVGYAIWMSRPQVKAHYFAQGSGSNTLYQNFRQWQGQQGGRLLLFTTGGFTNIHGMPEGLTIQEGALVNAVIMPDRHGLVIVERSGGVRVINLQSANILLPYGSKAYRIGSPLNSLVAYADLIRWAKATNATLFQTQLLAFGDQLMIHPGRARYQLRERRSLALVRSPQTQELFHVIFHFPTPYDMAEMAQDIHQVFQARGLKLEALLNLDVGSYDILECFNRQGHSIPTLKAPVPVQQATNLIVYTY